MMKGSIRIVSVAGVILLVLLIRKNEKANTEMNNIKSTLEELFHHLPDPFRLTNTEALNAFFRHPAILNLNKEPQTTSDQLITFISNHPSETEFIKTAVILLSQYDTEFFYEKLISLLAKKSQAFVESYEPGIWLTKLKEEKVVTDLFQQAKVFDDPFVLLLLQRPSAIAVKHELEELIANGGMPHRLYALFSYKYSLGKEDQEFLSQISVADNEPLIRALAGAYLLSLGAENGIEAVKSGLEDSNLETRRLTYFELLSYIPDDLRMQSNYDFEKDNTDKTIQDLLAGIKM